MSRFQALRAQVEVRIGDAGDVAPGPGEALNQPQCDRIASRRGHGADARKPTRAEVGGTAT